MTGGGGDLAEIVGWCPYWIFAHSLEWIMLEGEGSILW